MRSALVSPNGPEPISSEGEPVRAIVTRPRADAVAFASSLAGLGIGCVIAPVLEIAVRTDPTVERFLVDAQAVLMTSANGARALATNTARRDARILAVGDATAAAARGSGFGNVRSVDGDAAALAAQIVSAFDPAAGPLLHVCGSHVAGDVGTVLKRAGFAYRRLALYEAVAVETLPDSARGVLRDDAADGVALFSPRSAAIFVGLVDGGGMRDRLAHCDAWCLSRAVADAAEPERWRRILIASRPRVDAMRALMIAERDRSRRLSSGSPETRRSKARHGRSGDS